jgi:hypothetical protein
MAALTLATAVAVSPLFTPLLSVVATSLALRPAASSAAKAPSGSATLDPKIVLEDLAEDPVLRASQAVYDAAVLARPARGAPFTPLVDVAATPHARIVRAVSLVDAMLAPQPPELSVKAAALPRRPDLQTTIARVAAAVGVDRTFLVHTAVLESGLNPYARASTSSASGLFQFLDQTWLSAMARWGARYGHAAEARLIRFDRGGRAHVDDRRAELRILALRYDPALAAELAAELSADNARSLRTSLGRPPAAGELYAAHLLGIAGATRLIRRAYAAPGSSGALLFPDAAGANRHVFYRSGAELSVSEILVGGWSPGWIWRDASR